MQRSSFVAMATILFFSLSTPSCLTETITSAQAKVVVDELTLASQALGLTAGSIELATHFTVGGTVEAAAQEIKDFIESRLPCASITLYEATLAIEYGANPGNCAYAGQEYSGRQNITVESTPAGNVVVDHFWKDFTNGLVSVTGHAGVTWGLNGESRNIEHSLLWKRLSDGKEAAGIGSRTQTALAAGLVEGINVNGSVDWITKTIETNPPASQESESQDGNEWEMNIENVEMRWIDPVPQSGACSLETAFGPTVDATFERIDENTIAVTISADDDEYTFKVTKLGIVVD